MQYLLLDVVFLLPAVIIFARSQKPTRRRMLKAMALLLFLTLIFDNAIIAAGIVQYDPSRIVGLRLLFAPIEDFAYPIWAAIVLPFMYERFSNYESIT